MTCFTCWPGISTSEKPTADAATGVAVSSVVPSIVTRSVWKVREGKVSVWPDATWDEAFERVGDGILAVEGERDLRHPAGAVAALRLHQGDVVGGDRVGELRLPPLALGVRHEGAGDPGRVEVVVDRAVGLVLGRVGDRVAVAAGRHVHRAGVRGVGLGRDARAGEQLDRAVAQVGLGRVVARRLGVARVRRQRVPAEGLLAVGVGEHELGALGRQALQLRRLVGQRAGVVDGAVGVEHPEAGQVVEAGGVTLHDARRRCPTRRAAWPGGWARCR